MRNGDWIEPAVKVVFAISAALAVLGLIAVIHFVVKFW